MKKRIWLTLIASSMIAIGLPGRAVAQIAGPRPQALGPSGTNAETLIRRYVQNPFSRLPLPSKPAFPANQGLQLNAGPDSESSTAMTAGTFTSFDVPGAGTGRSQGTVPVGINPTGEIVGGYSDANNVSHGFLRNEDCDAEPHDQGCDGTITTLDVPGAGAGPFQGTNPTGINPQGAITGYYLDINNVAHAFVREKNCDAEGHGRECTGVITSFDAPGAGTGPSQGTVSLGINPAGEITGWYVDPNNAAHAFVREKNCDGENGDKNCNGSVITFDPPGSIFTVPVAINSEGTTTGYYLDAAFVLHGFLRDHDGNITPFDVVGGGNTNPSAINPDGAITGQYFQPIAGNPFGGNWRGFLRDRNGTFTTFDAATYSPCCIWTYPSGINPEGAITGHDNDGFNRNHGFLRAPDGTITTFDAPGAGTGNFQGTVPSSINPAGAITGSYTDANYVSHGFLLKQECVGHRSDKHCDADDHDH